MKIVNILLSESIIFIENKYSYSKFFIALSSAQIPCPSWSTTVGSSRSNFTFLASIQSSLYLQRTYELSTKHEIPIMVNPTMKELSEAPKTAEIKTLTFWMRVRIPRTG